MRSKSEIRKDLMKLIKSKEKRLTQMQMECGINFASASEITKKMIHEGLIKRSANGLYSLTEDGKIELMMAEITETKEDRIEVAKILLENVYFVYSEVLKRKEWRINKDGTPVSTESMEE